MTRLLMTSGHHSPRRGCFDCGHMQAHVTWWCESPQAIAARGTAIPGVVNCGHWTPCRRETRRWRAFLLSLCGWLPFEGEAAP